MQVGGPRVELGVADIEKIIPHRFPFLLVDRVIELESGKRGVGIKSVTVNEPYFQGHYPGQPVMPGVLIVEHIAQVGAIVLLSEQSFVGITPLIAGIEKARFRRKVIPGDRLVTTLEILWFRKGIGSMKGVATVDNEVVAEAELTFKVHRDGDAG